MESNSLLQINVTHPTALDHGLNSAKNISRMNNFVLAVEKIMNKKNKTQKVRMTHRNKLASVPDQLIHDIVSLSPEAIKCSRGEECPYHY